jgi:hypothetical protein
LQGCCSLAAALPALPSLRRLNLSETGLYKEGPLALAAIAARCSQLVELELSSNTVCDEAAQALAGAVEQGSWPHLARLIMRNNRWPFGGPALAALNQLARKQPSLVVDLGLPLPERLAAPGAAAATAGGGAAPASPFAAASSMGMGSSGPCSSPRVSSPSGRHRRSSSVASSVGSEDLCGVCFDAPNQVAVAQCGHRLCGEWGARIQGTADASWVPPAVLQPWGAVWAVCACRPADPAPRCCARAAPPAVECYREVCKPRSPQEGSTNAAPAQPLCPFCRSPMRGYVYCGDWLSTLAHAAAAPPLPA